MRPGQPSTHDLPPEHGARLTATGAEFCVYAGHADSVQLCLFDEGPDGREFERRIPLTNRAHGSWFVEVPGVTAGQKYGYRVDGTWDPAHGHRFNPAKFLLDPYGRYIDGHVTINPAIYAHAVQESLGGDPTVRDDRDSAPFLPRSVLIGNGFDWGDDRPPHTAWTDTVLYEVHVKNATATHPDIPEHLRGTYAGLCHPAMIKHLVSLGVTAVELLPVHANSAEPFLIQRGLTNHWGYNTLGFFAPESRYASAKDPHGAIAEFKGMVKLLHEAGIEVILDVVYNHTAEAGITGPTYSWRGLDGRAYYRLDGRGDDIDVTGCGNTMDLGHPVTCRMVIDSLRYWVTEMHVDGFRFDLAVALARGRNDDYDPNHAFIVSLRNDPILSRVKLIAEPWDLGMHGWRTGQFPPPFAEWNDRFRDSVRAFWLTDIAAQQQGWHSHGLSDIATRLAGSQDLFGMRDRGPIASINFIAAHDGFTTADLTAYEHKHNDANGEFGQDGTNTNHSYNFGVEGDTHLEEVQLVRRRAIRNMLATLIFAVGVPMINAGDEFGRSQAGNNNPYSQDNEISWLGWDLEPWQEDLLATTQYLTALRREYPVLHQRHFLAGRDVADDGSKDCAWYAGDGRYLIEQWSDPNQHVLQMALDGAWLDTKSVLVVLNNAIHDIDLVLPASPGATAYRLRWDSAWQRPMPDASLSTTADTPHEEFIAPGSHVPMDAMSVRLYEIIDPT